MTGWPLISTATCAWRIACRRLSRCSSSPTSFTLAILPVGQLDGGLLPELQIDRRGQRLHRRRANSSALPTIRSSIDGAKPAGQRAVLAGVARLVAAFLEHAERGHVAEHVVRVAGDPHGRPGQLALQPQRVIDHHLAGQAPPASGRRRSGPPGPGRDRSCGSCRSSSSSSRRRAWPARAPCLGRRSAPAPRAAAAARSRASPPRSPCRSGPRSGRGTVCSAASTAMASVRPWYSDQLLAAPRIRVLIGRRSRS